MLGLVLVFWVSSFLYLLCLYLTKKDTSLLL